MTPHSSIASTSTTPIFQEEEVGTPRKKKLRRQLSKEVRKSQAKTRKIRVLGQKLKRYKKKITSLKQLVNDLKAKNLLNEEHLLVFENIPDIAIELQKRKLGKRKKYSPELRQFAVTLSFFSPNAYNYVRRVFDTCLPHRSTIGKWFQKVDAEPGFTKEAFVTLKKHVELQNRPTLLSLVMDEIKIRELLEWDGKKTHGYVDYGVELEDEGNNQAKEAFVFMAVCINGKWKLPVGYFFTDGLNGQQKSALVLQCLKLIRETGARVLSLTFDGAPSNIAMINILGCQTDPTNIKCFFFI